MVTPIFVNSSVLLKSFKIHPLVLLVAQILDNAINFFLAFAIIFVVTAFSHNSLGKGVILLPLSFAVLFFGTFSLAWILATLNVFYRDTRFLITFVLNILFFMTPIFYPEALIPAEIRWLSHINPIYYLIKPIRAAIYQYDSQVFIVAFLMSLATAIMFFGIAVLIWKKMKNELYFKI